MLWQTAQDPRQAETILRCVQNSNTATGTITAGSIANGSPVIFETNTASLPNTIQTVGQNFVNRPATSTALVNNLMAGIIARVPGTKAYLDREEVGLAQIYGPHLSAILLRPTGGLSAGNVLIPESLQCLIGVTGPVTAAATSTSGHVEVPALGGHAILMSALATSGATETTTGIVFVRCM